MCGDSGARDREEIHVLGLLEVEGLIEGRRAAGIVLGLGFHLLAALGIRSIPQPHPTRKHKRAQNMNRRGMFQSSVMH